MKRFSLRSAVITVLLTAPIVAIGSSVSLPYSFTAGDPIVAAEVNANFEELESAVAVLEDGPQIHASHVCASPADIEDYDEITGTITGVNASAAVDVDSVKAGVVGVSTGTSTDSTSYGAGMWGHGETDLGSSVGVLGSSVASGAKTVGLYGVAQLRDGAGGVAIGVVGEAHALGPDTAIAIFGTADAGTNGRAYSGYFVDAPVRLPVVGTAEPFPCDSGSYGAIIFVDRDDANNDGDVLCACGRGDTDPGAGTATADLWYDVAKGYAFPCFP